MLRKVSKTLLTTTLLCSLIIGTMSARAEDVKDRFSALERKVRMMRLPRSSQADRQFLLKTIAQEIKALSGVVSDYAGYEKIATMLETVTASEELFSQRVGKFKQYSDMKSELALTKAKLTDPHMYLDLEEKYQPILEQIETDLGVQQPGRFRRWLQWAWGRKRDIALTLAGTAAGTYVLYRGMKGYREKKGREVWAEFQAIDKPLEFLNDISDADFSKMVSILTYQDLHDEEGNVLAKNQHIFDKLDKESDAYKKLTEKPDAEPEKDLGEQDTGTEKEREVERQKEAEEQQRERIKEGAVQGDWQAFIQLSEDDRNVLVESFDNEASQPLANSFNFEQARRFVYEGKWTRDFYVKLVESFPEKNQTAIRKLYAELSQRVKKEPKWDSFILLDTEEQLDVLKDFAPGRLFWRNEKKFYNLLQDIQRVDFGMLDKQVFDKILEIDRSKKGRKQLTQSEQVEGEGE